MFIFGMDFELLLKEFVVKRYLRIVNFLAVVAFVLILLSGLQMEISGGADFYGISFANYMIWHCIIGIVFCGLVGFHLYLNRKAFQISKKKGAMKWLMNIFIVSALTGVIVIFVVLRHNMQHSSLGGLHGKIGFLFLIFTFVHIIRHKNFSLKNVFVNEKYRS